MVASTMKLPWARGRSIDHDFKNLPPVNPRAKTSEELILGHMRLTLQVAAIYGGRPDVIGVAMYALVWAVDRWLSVKVDDNITPYIVTTIHSKLRDYLAEDTTIRIPARTQRAKKIDKKVMVTDYDTPAKGKVSLELTDALVQAATGPLDLKILKLRAEGYKDPAIAKMLGYSIAYISMQRAAFKLRFYELWNI